MPHIYKITNTINGKVYIGQTINSIEKRFKHHKAQRNCKNRCSALYNAFIKYGTENFIIESLICGDFTDTELDELEIEYINKYNSMSPNGYNLQTGGSSFRVSDKVKEKVSRKLKGRVITWGNKVSTSIKNLWQIPGYRDAQIRQRNNPRGKYRVGIKRDKLRVKVDLETLKNDYESGMPVSILISKHHISVPTLYRIIKENNVCKRKR